MTDSGIFSDDVLFTDGQIVSKITPFAKLRQLRGWSLEKASEVFATSKRNLIAIEKGRIDAPKQLVKQMDRVYGCKGRLIDYWLPL